MLDRERPICAAESCDSARVAAVGPLIFRGLTRGFDRLFLASRKQPNGCIVIPFKSKAGGYGNFSAYGQSWKAHRIIYELTVGPVPAGLFVCHRCDNPPCLNPAHLFLGTNADNMADQVAKGRSLRGEKHGRTKLSRIAVENIRRRIANGESARSVGLDYGISATHASRIHKRTTWNHLPDQPQPTEALS